MYLFMPMKLAEVLAASRRSQVSTVCVLSELDCGEGGLWT